MADEKKKSTKKATAKKATPEAKAPATDKKKKVAAAAVATPAAKKTKLDAEGVAETLACQDCSAKFVYSTEDQQRHKEKGFTRKPTRCPECRITKKATQRVSPCNDFKQGKCERGDKCRFSHEAVAPKAKKAVKAAGDCHAFQAGNCQRGEACKFAHVAAGSTKTTSTKTTKASTKK